MRIGYRPSSSRRMSSPHSIRDIAPVAPPYATTRPTLTPAKAAPAVRRDESKSAWVTVGLMVPLLAVNIWGASYYLATPAARVRHPLHALLRPSGAVGQSAGIAAFLIFVFLWLYPARKKWKKLAFTGSVGKWLDVHVAAALLLPLLLATH